MQHFQNLSLPSSENFEPFEETLCCPTPSPRQPPFYPPLCELDSLRLCTYLRSQHSHRCRQAAVFSTMHAGESDSCPFHTGTVSFQIVQNWMLSCLAVPFFIKVNTRKCKFSKNTSFWIIHRLCWTVEPWKNKTSLVFWKEKLIFV